MFNSIGRKGQIPIQLSLPEHSVLHRVYAGKKPGGSGLGNMVNSLIQSIISDFSMRNSMAVAQNKWQERHLTFPERPVLHEVYAGQQPITQYAQADHRCTGHEVGDGCGRHVLAAGQLVLPWGGGPDGGEGEHGGGHAGDGLP